MADASFDTLAVTRRLKSKGFDHDQAEAIAETVRAGITGGVATKTDLANLRGEINAQLARIESDLLWVKLIGGAIIAIIVAASGFVFNMLINMSIELTSMEKALVALTSGS